MNESFRDSVTKQEAEQWLAKFAPLILNNGQFRNADQVRQQIHRIEELKASVPGILMKTSGLAGSVDHEVISTLQSAAAQLDSIESELRQELSRLSPGDPQSRVDLDFLQERLAEREAKQEIGIPTARQVPTTLELVTSPANFAAGVGLGIFGLGWNAFTTLHCVLMIGGMSKAIGWGALALLAFYAIFFLAGFAMLAGAVTAWSTESISLVGRQLRIRKRFLRFDREKLVELAPGVMPRIGTPTSGVTAKNGKPVRSLILTDVNGKEICIGAMSSQGMRELHLKQLREYLQVYGN
jgi:hypothetical protein